jgi:hypothetical protein
MMEDDQTGVLARFQLLLEIEGFSSRLIEPVDDNPSRTLMVTIDDPEIDPGAWEIEVRMLPIVGDRGVPEQNPRIQFFSKICDGELISPNRELVRFILGLNLQLPLIGFHYSEALNMVFFNNFTTLSIDEPRADDQIVIDVTHMCAYILIKFGHMMIEAATGQKQSDELLGEVVELYRPK